MKECPFCNLHKDKHENVTLENEYCLFIQKDDEQLILEGCGLIIPKAHKENVFELSREEWNATYELLQEAKKLLDIKHSPDGYSLGWNVGRVSNQEVFHSHFHVIPRFKDEPYAGKGVRYWLKQKENMRPSR
jgi:histidine triad (HIT) family protein